MESAESATELFGSVTVPATVSPFEAVRRPSAVKALAVAFCKVDDAS